MVGVERLCDHVAVCAVVVVEYLERTEHGEKRGVIWLVFGFGSSMCNLWLVDGNNIQSMVKKGAIWLVFGFGSSMCHLWMVDG